MTHRIGFILPVLLALLTLSGSGLSQQARFAPSSLTFTPQLINLVSAGSGAQNVTLTNTGNADLQIASVSASGGYSETNDCSVLASGASCTISVTFVPGTIGPIKGAITIEDNAPSSLQVVSLSGSGLAPAQLSPMSLSFGTVAVGTDSGAKSLQIKATPGASFSINQIATSGNFAQTNNCPPTLNGGASCTINVTFHPTASVSVHGALSVSTAVGNTPLAYSATLSGTGSGTTLPQIVAKPAILNFGNKGPDIVDTTKTVVLTNTSNSTSVSLQNVSVAGSPNAMGAFPLYKISANTCDGMLTPGAQCKIGITFSTNFSEMFPLSYPGAITITDSDPTSPAVVGIMGKQVEQLTFKPSSLIFAPQAVGTTTTKTVTVTGNDDEQGLILDIVSSGDFSESGDLSGCFLTRGGECTMTVSFTPQQKGVINGSITLETYPECPPFPLHQCSRPVVLSLSGTGQ